jgi:beta-RFAP synthase
MVERPRTEIQVARSDALRCDPSLLCRAEPILSRVSRLAGLGSTPRLDLRIIGQPPPHSGFGSGTQLSLAIAEAASRLLGLSLAPKTLACDVADRGKRSAVGVHGYFRGGLIYENSQQPVPLNPLQRRLELPADWSVGLFWPKRETERVSGEIERRHFRRLGSASNGRRGKLRSAIVSRILPAAEAGDFEAFADAVQRYNRDSGLLFAPIQQGPYNGPEVDEVIRWLLQSGARGIGQSSWGPGVFAWFASREAAQALVDSVPPELAEASVTSVRNVARTLEPTPESAAVR